MCYYLILLFYLSESRIRYRPDSSITKLQSFCDLDTRIDRHQRAIIRQSSIIRHQRAKHTSICKTNTNSTSIKSLIKHSRLPKLSFVFSITWINKKDSTVYLGLLFLSILEMICCRPYDCRLCSLTRMFDALTPGLTTDLIRLVYFLMLRSEVRQPMKRNGPMCLMIYWICER